jgi:hypothetical protein
MTEHSAATGRDHFLLAVQEELAEAERREREFNKANREERAAKLGHSNRQWPSRGRELFQTAPLVVDQASSFNDTATITATSPIKIRPPGVSICHIGSSDAFIRQF